MISTGSSSWSIAVTFEDLSNVYPSPNLSTPTAFTVLTGSSNQFETLGTSAVPIAAYQFTLNTQSSAGARVTLGLDAGGHRMNGTPRNIRLLSPDAR